MNTEKFRNRNNETKKQQPYKKPRIEEVLLTTEDVLILGCKLDSAGGAPLHPVTCTGNFCAEAGS